MSYKTDDLRIADVREVVPYAELQAEFPITENAARTTHDTRQAIHRLLHGEDDRVLVIVGPCSIHDPAAALEYAARLKLVRERLAEDLLVVMRVYFEKPRTTVGWKGLISDPEAPLFFWPHRLDNYQKGCQLLADILYSVVSRYWHQNLQIVFVANGEYQSHFLDIRDFHGFEKRVAVCPFDERLSRLAYGASDFVLMPSRFEPCGLPQMIGCLYGSLPVAHDTGGIHDTITPLAVDQNTGNGFLFDIFDAQGLFWAIEQAMAFYDSPRAVKATQIERIMTQSMAQFTHAETARQYIALYEQMLQRPLIVDQQSNDVTR